MSTGSDDDGHRKSAIAEYPKKLLNNEKFNGRAHYAYDLQNKFFRTWNITEELKEGSTNIRRCTSAAELPINFDGNIKRRRFTAAFRIQRLNSGSEEAEKSKFVMMKVEQERRAVVIKAEGESESAKLISDATTAAGNGIIELRNIKAAK